MAVQFGSPMRLAAHAEVIPSGVTGYRISAKLTCGHEFTHPISLLRALLWEWQECDRFPCQECIAPAADRGAVPQRLREE